MDAETLIQIICAAVRRELPGASAEPVPLGCYVQRDGKKYIINVLVDTRGKRGK